MPSNDAGTGADAPRVPSMLDLVRMSPRRLFPPGGEALYRQIALLTDMSPDQEVLGVACGKGVSLGYFVTEHDVAASGVDVDPNMVEAAEAWARDAGLSDRLQFQTGRSDSLPYRDEIFDLTIGEIALASHCDPADAVEELVRVTKPGGSVVLVQLVWKAPVDDERRRILSEHLGARPLMLVEWKRLLKESGVQDLHTVDWSDDESSLHPAAVTPFPDFTELFTLPERLGILRRAGGRWGWRGVAAVLSRETEVHKVLSSERLLGLNVLRGRKGPSAGVVGIAPERPASAASTERISADPASASVVPPEAASTDVVDTQEVTASVAARPSGGTGEEPTRETDEEGDETEGLPLFGANEGEGHE